MVRRGRSAVAARPLGIPSSAIPANSAAITTPMRAGELVVTSTNQGRATAAISEPVVETTSARNSAASGRVIRVVRIMAAECIPGVTRVPYHARARRARAAIGPVQRAGQLLHDRRGSAAELLQHDPAIPPVLTDGLGPIALGRVRPH